MDVDLFCLTRWRSTLLFKYRYTHNDLMKEINMILFSRMRSIMLKKSHNKLCYNYNKMLQNITDLVEHLVAFIGESGGISSPPASPKKGPLN